MDHGCDHAYYCDIVIRLTKHSMEAFEDNSRSSNGIRPSTLNLAQ